MQCRSEWVERGCRARCIFSPKLGIIIQDFARQLFDQLLVLLVRRPAVVPSARLSCRTFAANAVRLQLHALAYNLGNFLRTLATPEPIKIPWGSG